MKTKLREKDFYKYLYKAVVTRNIDILLGLCYSIWRMPISIIDVEYNLIGMYPTHPVGDPTYDNIAKARTISDDKRNDFIKNYYLMNVHKSNAPTIIDWGVAKENHRYAYRLSSDNVLYGVISMVLMNGYAMDKDDEETFIRISEAATEILSVKQKSSRISNAPLSFLIYSLLTGASVNNETIRTYLTQANDDINGSVYILIRSESTSLDSSFYSENLIKKLKATMPDVNINLISDTLYLVLRNDNRQALENILLRKVIDTLLSYDLQHIYISDTFTEISNLRLYREQVDFLSSFVSKAKSNIVYYKDYSIMHIASFFPEDMRNMILKTSPIARLEEYDSTHDANLLETLYTYLNNASDNKKTSIEMNIHRNTLLNRINRIESITGLSTYNNYDLFNIRLYFILKEYSRKIQ